MNLRIFNWMKETRNLLPSNLGNVLDVGSLNVNGSAREVYTQFDSYLGIDIRKGKDVDVVMNGHDLIDSTFTDFYDTVVCMNTLEHDNKFWLTLEGINRVLKKGGYFIFAIPTLHFPIHSHPQDYWRMTEEAIREVIMEGYTILALKEINTKEDNGKPINFVICAIGRKL